MFQRSLSLLFRSCAALLCAALLQAVAGCAVPEPSATAPRDTLEPGWQAHSRPLTLHGPGIAIGTTAWTVPTLLPRGHYRVIRRSGDTAEVIDGYRFELDGNPAREVRLLLPSMYVGVEAIEEKYVRTAGKEGSPEFAVK